MSGSSNGAVKGLFTFFQLCGTLKHLKRTGWVRKAVQDPETVAGHMYRMALMAMLFDSQDQVDREKCIRMALVHDLAESLVGDITPNDGVSKEEKYRREAEGICHIQTLIPESVGTEIHELWKEYEEGKTSEAILVKDLDKFDMIFQAFEYERSQDRTGQLQEFFTSTEGKFNHPEVKKWVEQLLQDRVDHSLAQGLIKSRTEEK